MPTLPDYIVKSFLDGTVTRVEKETIPKGAASDSKNWVTKGDHIELRGGMAVKGTAQAGVGKITGMKVGRRFDGTQVLFFSHGRKLKYYDSVSADNVEIGSDTLPAAASGLDVAMDAYYSLAGAMVYIGGPYVGFFKIPVANPGSARDQSVTNHRGYFSIKQNRMFLWNRRDTTGGFDTTGLYGSYIDRDELSDYTSVSAEGIGSSGSTAYSGNLAAVTGVRTCMYVRIQASTADGTETFTDDRNGNLVSNFSGGSGTINYATGAYSVTFHAVTTGAVTADYYWEDATSNGILDFSKSATRTAGQGFVFRQDDGGGNMQNLGSIGDSEFSFHEFKTWRLVLSSDDTNATNLIYRSRVGIPYWRAKAEAGEGIYYVDSTDSSDPRVRLLTFDAGSDNIVPVSVSDKVDLSGYDMSEAVLFIWGKYLVLLCRNKSLDNTYNDTTWLYDRIDFKSWDRLDFALSVVDEIDGELVGGSSFSNNVFDLFSGYTDEEANLDNNWDSGKTNLDVEGIKSANLMVVSGLISVDQIIRVSIALDGGAFVQVKEIFGTGSYVDVGEQTTLGSQTIGGSPIGGGMHVAQVYPYRVEFRINTDRFEFLRYRFEAVGVGAATVSEVQVKDVRYKGRSIPPGYVSN